MNSRKEVRDLIKKFSGQPNPFAAILQLTLDFTVWFVALAVVAISDSLPAQLLGALVMACWSARLFVLGHDACHGSLTSFPRLNKVLGRLAFLPTLTAFSLWEVGHNVAHHGYTNLSTVDFVWTPLTPEAYQKLSSRQKLIYRLYRSGWFPGLYYLVDIWWKKLFFPNKAAMPTRRKAFLWDNLSTSAFLAMWLGALVAGASAADKSVALTILLGFVLPFFLWSTIMGLVVYVQHTHQAVPWYDNKAEWSADKAYLTTTVHIVAPGWVDRWLHRILRHTAHHVDMSIPYNRLIPAQQELESKLHGQITVQHFSWSWYFETARTCKLFDYRKKEWLSFPA